MLLDKRFYYYESMIWTMARWRLGDWWGCSIDSVEVMAGAIVIVVS